MLSKARVIQELDSSCCCTQYTQCAFQKILENCVSARRGCKCSCAYFEQRSATYTKSKIL